MIDSSWHTENLIITDATVEELPGLKQVMLSNEETFRLNGCGALEPGELEKWLSEGDLPPGAVRERYRLQTISRRDNKEVVGFLGLYHGYPDPKTLYISSLFIGRQHQNRGYGGEVAGGLRQASGLRGFPVHRLVVTVRNWGAVRFWVRNGFITITRIQGSLEEDNKPARLELTRALL